jgi:hypothetical protein
MISHWTDYGLERYRRVEDKMTDYEIIALVGLGLTYVASKIYLTEKGKKINHEEWINNYLIPKSKEVQSSINDFKNKLEKLTN